MRRKKKEKEKEEGRRLMKVHIQLQLDRSLLYPNNNCFLIFKSHLQIYNDKRNDRKDERTRKRKSSDARGRQRNEREKREEEVIPLSSEAQWISHAHTRSLSSSR